MRPKNLYLVLCVLGTILPYSQFVPFLQEHGLSPQLIVQQLFVNQIGAFFGLDVIVSSVVLWIFVRVEGAPVRRDSIVAAACGPTRGWRVPRVAALPLYAGSPARGMT